MTADTSLPLSVYRWASRALQAVPWGEKVRASLAGRQAGMAKWVAWGRSRSRDRRLIWIHAASVGEALAAEAVIRRLRATVEQPEIVLTHSSPSLASWPCPLGVAAVGYAPPEEPAAAQAMFEALDPALLIFSRSDLWPELLVAARARQVPVAVIGATVRPRSLRLRWPARPFLRHLYSHLRFVGAVSSQDADRWRSLGAPERAVVVTGDPRHDQVLERPSDLTMPRELTEWSRRGPTLVAGSVEEPDEALILQGLATMIGEHPNAQVLLVPHDPTRGNIRRLQERARRATVSVEVFHPPGTPAASCVIIEPRGILAGLYTMGSVAYVGGGFGRPGLHAVIEPASCGLPVLVGPEYALSRDADRMVVSGGAVALPHRAPATALVATWRMWLEDESLRNRAGEAARRTLQQGAAAATSRHLLALLPD